MNGTTPEYGWLPAAQQGETAALTEFFHCFQPAVYTLCLRLLGSTDDAEDATQATFIQAFRALPDFRRQSRLKTWLYRIAVNESLALRRKQRVQPLTLDDARCVLNDANLTLAGERLAVQQAMALVTPEHRAILVLRFWEQLEYAEMANVLGVSLSAVKMRLLRAKAEFQRRYEETQ